MSDCHQTTRNEAPSAGQSVVRDHDQDEPAPPGGMRLGGMRWIDQWVGLPLCAIFGMVLSLIHRVAPPRHRKVRGDRTIAVLKFFGLGSITEATPLLRAIRQRYPGSRLALVTFAENESLVAQLGLATDVRIIRTRTLAHFVVDVFRQIGWLRWHRTEAVVDLEFFSKFSTLLSLLSGARIRVGFHLNDFWRHSLLTHPIYFNYYRSLADVYEQAADRLGAPIDDHSLITLEPSEQARSEARALLEQHGWSGADPLLGINVNAGELSYERRWPRHHYAELIAALLERRADLRIVLTGTAAERDYVRGLIEMLPEHARERVINAAGAWTLEQFVAGLGMVDGFVTNDSGPLHLAAAVGVPIVSIWGPSRPDFYAPRGEHVRIVYQDYPCSPCVGMFTTYEGMWCRHMAWCMEAIAPDVVLTEVETMLDQTVRS